ncbi:hypothetical protein L7F22_050713 [Adiantum nelumboides]|nr:hypothetical protein [Adiantum nelumboides]
MILGMMTQEVTHEQRVKELEEHLAHAKDELQLHKEQAKRMLHAKEEVVGRLAITTHPMDTQTSPQLELPNLLEMPDQPGISHMEEEGTQELAQGALDIRERVRQNIEDMHEGPAKEYMKYELKLLSSQQIDLCFTNEDEVRELMKEYQNFNPEEGLAFLANYYSSVDMIKLCEIDVEVDVYVISTKGEGYPIILGRPWLIARQDWGTGMLELQPHRGTKKGEAIRVNLKDNKHESLDLETSVDEISSSDYSTSKEESIVIDQSDSSQAKIMRVVLIVPTMVSSTNVSHVEEDVFIDDIPEELPPKRGDDDHAIDLIANSSPPNKPPFRVSSSTRGDYETMNCKSLEEYNAKFGDALLPVSSFKIVPLAEQIEKYCCGLLKGIKKYCATTSVMNMAQLMENAELADDLIQGKPGEDGFKICCKESQGKQISAKGNVTSRLTVPPFKKKPFSGKARANFISPKLASKLGIRAEEMGMTREAGLGCPGHSEPVTPILGKLRLHIQSYVDAEEFHIMPLQDCGPVTPILGKLRLHIQNYVDAEEFHIMPLQDCDVLLGITWCYRLHAVVDTFHRKITLVHRGKTLVLDVKLGGESVPVVSASAISFVIRNHLFMYLVFAKEVHEVESNLSKLDKDTASFLNCFNDCFSDFLPDELLPKRPKDHRIDVVPGSSPPNRPP